MVEAVETPDLELQTFVGQYLAQGMTNDAIISQLCNIHTTTKAAAISILRAVYDSWSSVKIDLDITSVDDRNWHQYLRMELLRKSLESEDIQSRRLALRILDSLAGIQGIATTVEQVVPLPIILVEAEVEPNADKPEGAI